MKLHTILILLISILYSAPILACTGGTNAGTLSPTTGYQTQSVTNGQYYTINVTCGNTYNFTFCSNGGTAAWDTQITINQTDNTTQLAYNDDFCGLQSNVSWTANFTGSIHVLISLYSCNNAGGSNATLAYNVTPTSVSYNPSCTSASATINGATGGTFAFSPVPGDGAVINASTGLISSATEGASYTVQYTYCGGTISIPVTMGTAPCWTLNGNAQWINVSGEQCIQLTDEINDQTGCAWNGSLIDFTSDFTLSLDYYFGNNINGADGNTFTFQPSSSTACGGGGGQLGAGSIPNALAIEFDTYDNDNPTHLYDMSCDHVAIEIDGNMNGPGAPLCGPVCAKTGGGNIDDGGVYPVDIVWDASAQQLQVYFNGVLRLSCTNDFIVNAFGGNNQVYWGATSATGGLNNQQYFCPSSIVVLPVGLDKFETDCLEESEIVYWTTVTEENAAYFQLEYTYDGLLFYPAGTVDAVGNSTEMQSYSLRVNNTDNKQKYYRLKMVDWDGELEYTDLIASKNCWNSEDLIRALEDKEATYNFVLSEAASFQLVNEMGQLVKSGTSENDQIAIEKSTLSRGIYMIRIQGDSGAQEVRKLVQY